MQSQVMRTYLLVACLMPAGLLAQIAHSEVVGASGQTLSSPGYSVSYTLGEVMIDARRDTTRGFVLTEGFQQGYFSLTTVFSSPDAEMGIQVYPNPTARFLHLKSNHLRKIETHAQILDLQGITLLEFRIEPNNIIDLQALSGHAFLLWIYVPATGDIAIYKILKR